MALSNDELITAIQNNLDQSVNYAANALEEKRRKAWDYYLNRPRGDEMVGRSKVQDSTVRDTVHALLAQIMPAYATDHVIAYEPVGQNDVDQATAESNAVNMMFTESNNGYLQLHAAIHDCLLFRNGVMKVWVDDKETTSIRRFQANPADVLAQAGDVDIELIETDDETGISSFKIMANEQELVIETIEQARFFVDPNQSDQQLQDSSFLAELTYLKRSELLEMGAPHGTVKDLPATPDKSTTTGFFSNTDLTAKFIDGQSDVSDAATRDQDDIECFWIHLMIDRDGDGISERYRFLYSHKHILLDDAVDFVPYASGTGWPVPHRWSGLSVFDLSCDVQNQRTNAMRQMNDNMNVANNQRPIYDPGETEADDVEQGAPGRGIRSKNPGNVAFMPLQDIVSQSIAYLQYTDKIRGEQTGAALELVGEGQTMKQISGISAEMQLQPQEMMAALVSRNIAETLVRNLFVLIHRTLREYWNTPIMFNKSGDWQETLPAEWPPRNRLNVNVGLSPGERRRQNQALQFVLEQQTMMIQAGNANIVTDLNGWHKAMTDWTKSAELDGAEAYFMDPEGQASMAGQQAQAQQAQEAQAKEEGLIQAQLQLEERDRQIDGMKNDLDKYKHDTELRFKYWEQLLQTDVKEQELAIEAQSAAQSGGQTDAGSNGLSGPGQRDSD